MNWYDEARTRQQELQQDAARIHLAARWGRPTYMRLLDALRAWRIGAKARPAPTVAGESVHPHLAIVPAGAEPAEGVLGHLPAADGGLLALPAAEAVIEDDAVVEHRLAKGLGSVAVLPGVPFASVEEPAGQPVIANLMSARTEHRHHKRVGFLRRFFRRVDESSPDSLPRQLIPVLLLRSQRPEPRRSRPPYPDDGHHHGEEPKNDHDINEHSRYVHDCTSI
jgi:hypothetical protein